MKGKITRRCRNKVRAAAKYISIDSLKQADILIDTFNEIATKICKNPEMGRSYENGMRKIKLGKFSYNIYFKVKKDIIEFVGIWHTSRGTDFCEKY
jgi:plasmid stabilization system protein ParE